MLERESGFVFVAFVFGLVNLLLGLCLCFWGLWSCDFWILILYS